MIGQKVLILDEVAETVELQWLGHLWNTENMFETGVVRANEGQVRWHYRDIFFEFL